LINNELLPDFYKEFFLGRMKMPNNTNRIKEFGWSLEKAIDELDQYDALQRPTDNVNEQGERSSSPVQDSLVRFEEGNIKDGLRIITLYSKKSSVEIGLAQFDDGTIYVRVIKKAGETTPDDMKRRLAGQEFRLKHSFRTANDQWQAIKIMSALKQKGAKSVHLILPYRPLRKSARDNLLPIFADYADKISVETKSGKLRELEVTNKIEPFEVERFPITVDDIYFIGQRHRQAAKRIARSLKFTPEVKSLTPYTRIGKRTPRRPRKIKGRDVVIIGTTSTSREIMDLFAALDYLRQKEVRSITFINTYIGDARMDRAEILGELISAATILQMINRRVDHHFAFTPHFGFKSGISVIPGFPGLKVINLNGFVPLAVRLAQIAVHQVTGRKVTFDIKERKDLKLRSIIEQEFRDHPIILVSPDDGARYFTSEAAYVLNRTLYYMFGIDIPVYAAYLPKTRLDSRTIVRPEDPKLYDVATDKVLKLNDGKPLSEARAFILDDLTQTGSTINSAVDILVNVLGIQWNRVFAGVVHFIGEDFEAFRTDLEDLQAVTKETRPDEKLIKNDGEMPPAVMIFMNSLNNTGKLAKAKSDGVGVIYSVSNSHLEEFAIKRIVGVKWAPLSAIEFVIEHINDPGIEGDTRSTVWARHPNAELRSLVTAVKRYDKKHDKKLFVGGWPELIRKSALEPSYWSSSSMAFSRDQPNSLILLVLLGIFILPRKNSL